MRRLALFLCLICLGCPGKPGGKTAAEEPSDGQTKTAASPDRETADPYPTSVAPPAGLQWPTPLTALPRDLPGVPAGDHRFLKHTFAAVLAASRAKLIMLNGLLAYTKAGKRDVDLPRMLAGYVDATVAARKALAGLTAPAGLDVFVKLLLNALGHQEQYFKKSVRLALSGKGWKVLKLPESARASLKLNQAYELLHKRYAQSAPTTLESLKSHLKVLDIH